MSVSVSFGATSGSSFKSARGLSFWDPHYDPFGFALERAFSGSFSRSQQHSKHSSVKFSHYPAVEISHISAVLVAVLKTLFSAHRLAFLCSHRATIWQAIVVSFFFAIGGTFSSANYKT